MRINYTINIYTDESSGYCCLTAIWDHILVVPNGSAAIKNALVTKLTANIQGYKVNFSTTGMVFPNSWTQNKPVLPDNIVVAFQNKLSSKPILTFRTQHFLWEVWLDVRNLAHRQCFIYPCSQNTAIYIVGRRHMKTTYVHKLIHTNNSNYIQWSVR